MTKTETSKCCPNCKANKFTLSESSFYKAKICPDTGDLLCENDPFEGDYETIICDICEHQISPNDFKIDFV